MLRLPKLFVIAATFVAVGCGDDSTGGDGDGDGDTCTVTPSEWAAPDFEANAASSLTLRAQLDALVAAHATDVVVVDELEDLTSLYEAGNPSLAATTAASFDAIVQDSFADFVALALAGEQDLVDDDSNWTPGDDGGIFGTRGINAGGIEVRQIVDKGLFGGGALYAHALALTEGTIDEASIDGLAAAFGTDAALDPEARTDSANYAFGMGFHGEITGHLTDAKAYAADANCEAERDEAIVSFFRAWEQALIARTIFYANAGSQALSAAEDDPAIADALHELGEGFGLTVGFYGLADPASGPLAGAGRVITDADIEAMMPALGVDLADLSASSTGPFVEDRPALESGVIDFEATATDVYGLSDADLAAYRAPSEG
jgi:hypothetical protein